MLRAEGSQVNPRGIRKDAWLTCTLKVAATAPNQKGAAFPRLRYRISETTEQPPGRSELQSTLLIAAVLLSLTLLARTVVLGIARLGLAMTLLILLLLVRVAPLLLIAALFVLGLLLVTLRLAALLSGIPVLVCHWDVS
jgi:hypothetical protein